MSVTKQPAMERANSTLKTGIGASIAINHLTFKEVLHPNGKIEKSVTVMREPKIQRIWLINRTNEGIANIFLNLGKFFILRFVAVDFLYRVTESGRSGKKWAMLPRMNIWTSQFVENVRLWRSLQIPNLHIIY